MGASNVALAYARWSRLADRPFRLLAYMALVSLDRDDPPRFWGGREDLATALGRAVPPEPHDNDDSDPARAAVRQRRAAFEAVRSGMAQLKEVGAVTVARQAKAGTRAEYLLHLAQASPVPQAQANPVPAVQANPAGETGQPCLEAQAQPGPKEKGGGLGLQRGGDGLGLSPHQRDDSRLPRARHDCTSGWLSEDRDGSAVPCPTCKPHTIRTSA